MILVCGAILTCGSTLLLAVYWIEMIANEGLASVECVSRKAKGVAAVCAGMGLSALYAVMIELCLERDARLLCL